MKKPIPDYHENDPTTGADERALLIIQTVVCACGAYWTDSNLIFKGAGYSYHITQQRYDALRDRSLRLEGHRVHERLVPICHNCAGILPQGWQDAADGGNPDPHYPYEQWPDKHRKLVAAAKRRPNRPHRISDEITSLVDKALDDIS